MMSIVLQRPDDARARPSSLIKKDEDYNRIFDPTFAINIYLIAATIVKVAHASLRAREDLAPKDRTNLLFYTAMYASAALVGIAQPYPDQLAKIELKNITEEFMQGNIDSVEQLYRELGANDQVAKGSTMLKALKEKLAAKYPLKQIGY